MNSRFKVAIFAVAAAWRLPCVGAEATPSAPGIAPLQETVDSEELARMYAEDQSDRKPTAGQEIDWNVVEPRDKAREARVKELYATGQLKTGKDYQRAAMVLQHASKPEDYLLAHELCVIAIFKGVDARWLAAASEDRFLRSIRRPQRFGTQSGKSGDSPWSMGEVDPSVVDSHRAAMKVPALDQAKARVDKQNEMERAKSSNPASEPLKEPNPVPAPVTSSGALQSR